MADYSPPPFRNPSPRTKEFPLDQLEYRVESLRLFGHLQSLVFRLIILGVIIWWCNTSIFPTIVQIVTLLS